MTNDFNYKELDNLTEEEKKYALKILEELSKNGSSKTYDNILYADYREIPVDIETFITDDRYLGRAWKDSTGKLKMYPYWMGVLKDLFPNNIDTSVNNLIESGARGLGKSEIAAGAVSLYLMYRVLCLKNPLEHFGLKPTEKICFAYMNIKLELAEDIGISKLQKTVQLSPWFMSKGSMSQRNGRPYWNPPEPIQIIIGSQSSDVIGQPIFFALFDEISFIRNMDIDRQKAIAIDMVDTALGGMKTRFIVGGKNPTLMTLASSKRSEKSFLEQHMKDKLKSEKENVIIVDEPVWKVKPKGTYSDETFKVALGNKFLQSQVISDDEDENTWLSKGYKILNVPIDFKANFIDDIDRALCDFAGISSSDISTYINGANLFETIHEEYQNPFMNDVLEIGNAKEDTAQYYNFFDLTKIQKEMMSKPLYVHLDMSISGDMTGIAGVWIKGKKVTTDGQPSKDLMFKLAFSVSIKAPKGRQISFEKNRNFIRWLKQSGFKVKGITSDTFQAYDLQQQLNAEGFNCDILSVDRVDSDHICKPYQYFRSTIYEKRIEMYNSKRLNEEITSLERNNSSGKIDHPPNGHKDVSDAVCGAVFNASKHAEEFAYDYGESLETIVDVSNQTNSEESVRQQISVDFEELLKQVQDPLKLNNSIKNTQLGFNRNDDYEDAFLIAQGIII